MDESRKFKYLFGPVPSRRFGRSLGVDLVPFKKCSFDCVFCQLGKTDKTTMERKAYAPIEDVLGELGEWLERDGRADFITLSGSGEPTLHKDFGKVFDFVRDNSDISTLLLTNSSTLMNAEVRAGAAKADVVKASLSAWDQESLVRMNRPSSELGFDEIVEGLKLFREEYGGELRLEVFLVAGVNDCAEDVSRIASLADSIRPDLVQLNTAVRPPAEKIGAVSRAKMEELARLFNQPSEVIANFKSAGGGASQTGREEILAMLKRRPCTVSHIAEVFGMHRNEAVKHIALLMESGVIERKEEKGETYYFCSSLR